MTQAELGFDDFVSQPVNDIYGISTINHNKRVKMGLTVNQYCVADFVAYSNSKSRQITYEYIHMKLGIDKEHFLSTAQSLIDLKFLEKKSDGLKVTRKWLDTFMIGEEWFEAFWLVHNKTWWTGSKKDAKAKFVQACKFYAPEYLIDCRDHYIKYLAHPVNHWRHPMAAAVFLGLEKERFKEDWSGSLKRIINPGTALPAQMEKPLTSKKREELFQ